MPFRPVKLLKTYSYLKARGGRPVEPKLPKIKIEVLVMTNKIDLTEKTNFSILGQRFNGPAWLGFLFLVVIVVLLLLGTSNELFEGKSLGEDKMPMQGVTPPLLDPSEKTSNPDKLIVQPFESVPSKLNSARTVETTGTPFTKKLTLCSGYGAGCIALPSNDPSFCTHLEWPEVNFKIGRFEFISIHEKEGAFSDFTKLKLLNHKVFPNNYKENVKVCGNTPDTSKRWVEVQVTVYP